MTTRPRRGAVTLLTLFVKLGVAGALTVRALIVGGLADADGRIVVNGLAADAEIRRDARGVVDVEAASLDDLAFAQGFVHAQDRYFQMDAARRLAAGRLAELVGPSGRRYDRTMRGKLLADVADRALERLPAAQRRLLDRYVEGVRAGLDNLEAPPPEYLLLGAAPEPWTARDSLLVVLAMFDLLVSDNERIEYAAGVMQAALPSALYQFLTPETSRFDAPMDGPPGDPDGPAPIPGPDVADVRPLGWSAGAPPLASGDGVATPRAIGSNGWAVAGRRTTHGGAILASDMHLPLTAPNVWHRMRLRWPGAFAVGVTLPGAPGVVAGANGHIAWGFTNVHGDFTDLVRIEEAEGGYRVPGGVEPFEVRREVIRVRWGEPVELIVRVTRWGPIVRTDWNGAPLARCWTADRPGAVDFDLLSMMAAKTLEDAVQAARGWGGPPQNVMIAAADGRIAWTVSGHLPKRRGVDGRTPASWANGDGWDGQIDDDDRPMIIDPPGGAVWTANARAVSVARAGAIGHSFSFGGRASRIGELLHAARGPLDEPDLLRQQLDTRVATFDAYRELIAEIVRRHPAPTELHRRAARAAAAWRGGAAIDDAGHELVRTFARRVKSSVLAPFVERCRTLDPSFNYAWPLGEEVVRRLLETRPPHLLHRRYADWDDLLRTQLDASIAEVAAAPGGLGRPWGRANSFPVRHPLSAAAGLGAPLGDWLDMPELPMAGDYGAVRVIGPRFGASQRLVVSPGREEHGILHMPGGQSGNPFSGTYRVGHDAWVRGEAAPLNPGRPTSRLTLTPAAPR